ncbi:molybdopterin molybdotransferase MoeA [Dyella silvae]|uniref:molybdopterin molybdotransferase MoeA n=1 Tax=Dyella silvae TaxID=2994424 RepID=UPI002264BAE5|nr:gephyrin-like molybdotransferase Glp [Dyella silvae]
MIGYEQALERLMAHARQLPAERCARSAALGRVLASDVISPMALPSFDHAAMDGYALNASQPCEAGSEHVVIGSQAAGDKAQSSSGMAWEIMTGAHLPDGLNAVVPVERTQLLETRADGAPQRIRLLDRLEQGANVRYAGSDVAEGRTVITAGTRIEPAHVMLLAALGVATVAVVRAPRVAVIATGKELQPDPTQPLVPGQIYGSNGPYLVAALAAAGAQVLSCDTVDDTADTYADAIQRAHRAGADVIISTGAVSMGRYDFVPDTLRALGAELLFHKVAMRPGKPLLAARLANGTLVMALPGTPMAVAVGFRFFVVPVLRAMRGQATERPLYAVLDAPQQSKPGLCHFLRATVTQDREGRLHAHVLSRPQPFRMEPFVQADVWVVLPENAGECLAGSMVLIAGLQPGALFAEMSQMPQEAAS